MMSQKKIVYIYTLVDPRNNEVFYVGYTQYLRKRYLSHLNTKGYRREKNYFKDNVINKIFLVGLKPKINVIDKCDLIFDNKQKMYVHEKLEIKYIQKYRDLGVRLTNLTNGGDGGCTHFKKVFQYSEDGCFIKEYNSVNDFASVYKINASLVSRTINQRIKKSYRKTYLFSSKDNANKFRFKKTKTINLPIIKFDLNNNVICEYKSQRNASNLNNIAQPNINHCLRGKRKTAGGFIWKYK